MSIQSDIVTALASVAGGEVYPDAAPEKVMPPLVIYRRVKHEPLMTLQGFSGTSNSDFLFECWGAKTASTTAKQSALTLAASVIAAIEAYSGLQNKYRTAVSGENVDPETLEIMEPVQYSFWHGE